jgi:hypothetical protein
MTTYITDTDIEPGDLVWEVNPRRIRLMRVLRMLCGFAVCEWHEPVLIETVRGLIHVNGLPRVSVFHVSDLTRRVE